MPDRTNATIGTPRGPSERSQVIARNPGEVINTEAPLANLGQIFGSFYGMASRAASRMADADQLVKTYEINEENELQKQQATADVLSGKVTSLEDVQDVTDADYFQTVEKALGEQYGLEMARTHAEALQSLPVDQDARAFTEQFLEEALNNGGQFGTGSAVFDATLLATFKKLSDVPIEQHRVAAVKAKVVQEQTRYLSNVGRKFQAGGMGVGDLGIAIADLQKISPLNPQAALPTLVESLVSAAGNDPQKLAELDTLFGQIGAIHDGEDFRSVYDALGPVAAEQIEDRLTNAWTQGLSLAGAQKYELLEKQLLGADDPEALIGIAIEAEAVRGQFGGESRRDAILTKVATKMAKLEEHTLGLNNVLAMIRGEVPKDFSEMAKYQREIIGDWAADPVTAAQGVMEMSNVLNADIKKEIENGLVSLDASTYQQSVLFLSTIENRQGRQAVASMVSAEAALEYAYAKRKMTYERRPLDEVLEERRKVSGDLKSINQISYKQITGESENAEGVLYKLIESELESRFELGTALGRALSSEVTIDPVVLGDLAAMAKREQIKRHGATSEGFEETLSDVLDLAKDSLSLSIREDGRVSIAPTLVPKMIPDAEGKLVASVPISETAFNQDTGETENTLEIARGDLSDLSDWLSEVGDQVGMDLSDEDNYSLNARTRWASKGLYLVENSGRPVVFQAGQTYQVGGQDVTIPEDPEAAAEYLESLSLAGRPFSQDPTRTENSPMDRFAFVSLGDGAFALAYQPGFRYRIPTLADQEDAYRAVNQLPPRGELENISERYKEKFGVNPGNATDPVPEKPEEPLRLRDPELPPRGELENIQERFKATFGVDPGGSTAEEGP